MSGFFRKAVLNVGEYHSPDGLVKVTPARLQHWKQQVSRLQRTGYAIPMHWDHSSDIELLEPIKMDALKRKSGRSAENTVGKLVSFDLSKDGKSAELTVQTLTPSATEKAASNAVYVSPVLFDQWTDGAGNQYSDTIGSIDLVDYPVDHSQGPFVPVEATRLGCAIRMSSSPSKVFRLSELPMDKKYKPDDESDDESDDSDPSDDVGGEIPDAADDGSQENTEAGEETPEDADELNRVDDEAASTSMAELITHLERLKVILPADTTEDNLLERLLPAVATAAAHCEEEESEMQSDEYQDPQQQGTPEVDQNPMIATMSLRIKKLESQRLDNGKKLIAKRLQKLLESGRCTPSEHQKQIKRLSVTKLSLDKQDRIQGGTLAVWLEARESTPKGSCWKSSTLAKRMSAKPVDPPEEHHVNPDSGGLTPKQEAAAVNALLSRRR